jgi:hypothetical protein
MDDAKLIEKLRRIEALHAGATTEGERVAAAEAKKSILARLAETTPPVEYRFSLAEVELQGVVRAAGVRARTDRGARARR